MATTTRTIKPARLDSCECLSRPVYASDEGPACEGGILINGDFYSILPLGEGTRDGYRLVKEESGDIHDLDTSSGYPVCDCPDFTFRRGRTGPLDQCRHGLALIALRKNRMI